MKRLLFLAALVPLAAQAQNYGSHYDWKTGNYYSWSPSYGGGTQVYGNNFQNGTTWQQNIQPNGNMNGTDGNGNPWSYNNGTYMNYGTGEIRYDWQNQ